MEIKVTINKYAEGRSAVPSTDLISTATETWYGTTPIVNVGKALEDSEGDPKIFAPSLANSITKVGTRYLNTIYWKEEGTAYLSEITDNWEYTGTNNIIINLYYGKTQNSTSYKPSEEELGPTGPIVPTTYSVKVYNYLDGIKNLLFTATSYGEIRVHTYSVDLTYMDDNKTQQQLEGDIPISKRIQKVTVNGTDITSTNGWKSYYSDVEVIYYFESDNYTVTLNNQGATTAGTASVTATYGLAMPSITKPSRTGYTFGGYYTGTNGSGTQYYKEDGLSAKTWDIRSNTTLYAKWTINKYTLTWNANGGTLSGSYTSGSVEYGYPITAPSVSRTGYTFKGWSNGTSIVTPESTMPANNLTYTAQWTANNYTVVFNANGGTGIMQNQSFTYGTAKALTANAFERSGYTFNGWNTKADGTGKSYTDKQSVNNLTSDKNGTVILYAQWTADTITITWDPNGGRVSPTSSSYTYNGASVSLPTPSRTGYTFNGWYTASSGGKRITDIGTTNKPAANVTYYAQWSIISYTITYYIDGVKDTSLGNPTTYTVATSTITLKNPTKSNYTGSGWRLNSASGAQYTQIAKGSTGNKTFYWTWTPNTYNLTWNPNGGNWNGNTDNIVNTCGYETTVTKPSNPVREGYSFNGWKDQDGNTTVVTTMPAKDLTYTAQWSANSYTINLNGGSSSQTSVRIKYGTNTFLNTSTSAETTITTPTKTGHTFLGWYTGSGGTGSLIINTNGILQANVPGYTDQNGKWARAENVTVYAKWEGDACTITVNANPSELTSRLSGGGNYRNGDNVTISAPSGYDVYKFINWTKSNSVVSTTTTYNFTANGNATYVANFIDNRKSALFKIHILDDSYNETGLCNVEIKYGDLDNPGENTITRAGNTTIEITGPSSTCSVIKTHISGTNFLDKVNGALTSQLFYAFPESINNEPFINILYNGNVIENEYSYTNNSLEFDVYYGNLPKNESGGGSGEPGDSDNSEIMVRFKYYLDGKEIDTSNAAYISWPERNISELKCYWFKYDSYTKNDREIAITGIPDRIQFSYVDTYWGDPAKSDPYSNLKNVLEIQAPSFTGLADSVYLTGVDTHDTNKTYTYVDCPTNQLDICIYFESYKFNAYVYSNLPEYGDAYIAQKGTTHVVFHASDVDPTAIRFDAEVLNDAYEFNRWVNYNDENEVALSTKNPWTIHRPQAQDYHIEAIFTGRQLNVALDPNDGTAHAWWQHVGIVAGTKRFKTVSFNLDEDVRKPSDRTGYEFLGWYTSKTNDGYLIIDKNGVLQANVPGWTTSDGLWIKGPTVDTSECTHNVIVYAKWKPIEYTITYKNLKGAVNPSANPSTYTIETPTITFVAPTKNLPRGYTWSKWNPSSIAKGSTGNKTITAEWLTNKYTLTWNLNGGTVTTVGTCAPLNSTGTVSGQVDYLSNITAPIVSKNGYKFEGWSVNGVDVITPASKMPDGNITYIAVYSIKTYKISVNSIPTLDKVYIKVNDVLKGTTTTCTTNDKITLIAENVNEYLLSYWQKSGGNVVSGQNEFTFTANDTYLDDAIDNNIFTAYYKQDPRATLKINFIVDDFIEKTAIFKFNETFSFLGNSSTDGYRCEIQGKAECIEGNIDINQQRFFFIPNKYNGKDICNVAGTEMICSNKGNTIGYDGYNSQYYEDNTVKNKYCPTGFEWKAYLPTNIADETHLVFPSVEKEEYGILYGPLIIDVYYGEIPERFLPVVPDDVEITTVSGLTLLQRIQNKIATFKWLNNLFGEPEKTTWDSYDNSGLKGFLKDDSKETPSSMHCIEYGDLQIYNQESGNENINLDKTIKQYSLTLDNIIKPLNGQVILDVSKIEGNKIYFNISNLSGFTNTSNGIYIYFSVNNETDENNATLYKMKLPKTPSNKGLLLTIPDVSNIESLYIYRTPIMVDSTKTGITPKIYFNSEKGDLSISVYDRTTLNTVI